MARIRSVKPEFWSDDVVGSLTRDARLLFIGSWNFADDEGLLRWTPAFLKASVFMYDGDLRVAKVESLMGEVVDAGLVFPYVSGKAAGTLGCVVNFRKHQKVNRPQPGKLPPPSLQSRAVIEMYARRDGWVCHLCKGPIDDEWHAAPMDIYAPDATDRRALNPSPDHLTPRSQGGSDYPSNVATAHVGCNKSRGDGPVEAFVVPMSVRRFLMPDSVNDSVNGAVTPSLSDQPGDVNAH
jgi:hypothetical protein